jgi:curli biogenesis system outer membrane secretion channel CsgG
MLLELTLLLFGLTQAPTAPASQAEARAPEAKAAPKIDPEIAEKLLKVKRIYVDSFGDDNVSRQLHAMVINALDVSKRFIITENKEKADAILKGSALEKTSQEFHALGEAAAAGVAAGGHSGSVSGHISGGTGSTSGSHSGGFAAKTMAAEDTVASTETINDARLAVRLVAPDGDVIWTTTQESKGAKYKGASADVADKVVKQLLRDLEKLKKAPEAETNTP